MKAFNLELAKQGKPVCTRDGRNARILCFDFHMSPYGTKILCAIESSEHKYVENTIFVDNRGHYTEGYESPQDIMMASEKHEGWVNIYRNTYNGDYASILYAKEENAITEKDLKSTEDWVYVATTKIEWEE